MGRCGLTLPGDVERVRILGTKKRRTRRVSKNRTRLVNASNDDDDETQRVGRRTNAAESAPSLRQCNKSRVFGGVCVLQWRRRRGGQSWFDAPPGSTLSVKRKNAKTRPNGKTSEKCVDDGEDVELTCHAPPMTLRAPCEPIPFAKTALPGTNLCPGCRKKTKKT